MEGSIEKLRTEIGSLSDLMPSIEAQKERVWKDSKLEGALAIENLDGIYKASRRAFLYNENGDQQGAMNSAEQLRIKGKEIRIVGTEKFVAVSTLDGREGWLRLEAIDFTS